MGIKKFFNGIFHKNRKKVYVLDPVMLSQRKSQPEYILPEKEDKSIFEIKKIFILNKRGTVICGKVKRGFFKVGDVISVCNPADADEKISVEIKNIITPLVESNTVRNGTEAELLVDYEGGNIPQGLVNPGDRAYKKCKTGGIKNALQ